nr:LLM class flavin-dependent oxidoreductase [Pseudonocardia oroxyli]
MSHAQRYERAGEILDAVRTLWDSWGSDAVVADKAGGRFLRDAHVGDFAVRGTQFAVAGRFTTPRSPQGHPVVLQAGESPAGRDFAAARSDAIFSRYSTFAEARAFYTDVKARVARLGRDPEQVEILPSASVILGDTEAEARDRHRDVRSRQVDPFTAVVLVETVWSRDLSGVDPDGPVPDLEPPRGWTRSSTGSSRCGASAVSCGPPTPGRRCASTSACPSRPVSANPPRRAPPPDLVPAHPVLPKESRHDRQTPPVAVARPPRRRPGPVRVRRWGRRRGRR